MNNLKKYYINYISYSIGLMFCTGAIMQTFLLQTGFTEQQVYAFNSLTQIAQVAMMCVMTFFASKIRKVTQTTAFFSIGFVLLAGMFLLGALAPSFRGNSYLVTTFIVAGVAYLGIGAANVLTYCVPYHIMDMKDYGRVLSFGAVLAGSVTFGLSFLHTYIVAKFDYMQATVWFFVLAFVCFMLQTWAYFSFKQIKGAQFVQSTKDDLLGVFKNKNTYILLLPNFTRGLAMGVMNVITVIAITNNLLNAENSSYVNIITQITTLLGSLIFSWTCAKIPSKNLLIFGTLGASLMLPLCLQFGTVGFLIFFTLAIFSRVFVDTGIPVLVTEIIPQNQIGPFTSIRMLVFTLAQAVATLIITPIVSAIGYTGLLIFSAVMQFICGATYYIVARKNKNLTNVTAETTDEKTDATLSPQTEEIAIAETEV